MQRMDRKFYKSGERFGQNEYICIAYMNKLGEISEEVMLNEK